MNFHVHPLLSVVLIILFSSLYSYFYESELKHKVADWESYHQRIVNGKNEQLFAALQKLKGSMSQITSLEDELRDVKAEAKRYWLHNQQLSNQLVVEKGVIEEMQMVLTSKEKRIAREERELLRQAKSLEERTTMLQEKEQELHERELEVLKKEDLLDKLPPAVTLNQQKKKKKNTTFLTYALYRVLYGEDFIQDSILSIIDHVDKIFVFWDDRPWGDVKEAKYKGNIVKIPSKIDNVAGTFPLVTL